MVRIILALIFLFAPSQIWAFGVQQGISGPVAGGGEDCTSGTYLSAWDAQYPSDADKLCVDSGDTNKDGTISGGTLSTDGYTVTDKDQYLEWSVSAADILDEDTGTIFIEVNFDSGNDANVDFFEALYDSSNMIVFTYAESTTQITAYRAGGGATDSVGDGSVTTAKNVTVTFGYTWDVGNATADHAISIDKGTTWYDDGVDGIATMTNNPTAIRLGNLEKSTSSDQVYTITRFATVSEYEGVCPW